MVEVILAGYNVDKQALEELVEKGKITREDFHNLTPESISAAYARISRSKKTVTELREEARKDIIKARKSNKIIVYDMGHHSIAEHAYFNFDILKISRFCIEELEKQRLCSFTEKSQRYVTLDGDFVIPSEFSESEKQIFIELVEKVQNPFYFKAYPVLLGYQREKNPELAKIADDNEKKRIPDELNRAKNTLEGLAKEDARYALSIATETQTGFSTNACNLEKFIRYTATCKIAEVRKLGEKLLELANELTPSLIIFTEPNEYFKGGKDRLKKYINGIEIENSLLFPKHLTKKNVTLIDPNHDSDNKLIATLIQSVTNEPFIEAYSKSPTQEQQKEIIKKRLENIEEWDAVPREFEIPDLLYELIISSSNFAQLKRHRMLTLLPLDYDLSLGYTIPDSIEEIGLKSEFSRLIEKTNNIYKKIKQTNPYAADYVLTNAHRRRVLLKTSARELYHISRLREDEYAQWDIRRTTNRMVFLAKKVMPLTMMLIGGKHNFKETYREAYNE